MLVLLPPAESGILDFYDQGFVSAVKELGLAVDVVAAGLTYRHVMAKTIVPTLVEHIMGPARDAGYREIWLVGISLGAFSALHFACERPGEIAGVLLLAPYPGTSDVLSEIVAAGGPIPWDRTQNAAQAKDERRWWRWLCGRLMDKQVNPQVFLSSGSDDRFIRGQRLLAEVLPADHVRWMKGKHDWETWRQLWTDWLVQGPLSRRLDNRAKVL